MKQKIRATAPMPTNLSIHDLRFLSLADAATKSSCVSVGGGKGCSLVAERTQLAHMSTSARLDSSSCLGRPASSHVEAFACKNACSLVY
eukprot:scaffold336352_cov35-Prasinocladus_malaysianus.AAC.1